MTEAASLERRRGLHRRAVWLEYFTVGGNVIEGEVAIGAGMIAGSVALVGFGVDSSIEVISAPGAAVAAAQGRPRRHPVQEESGAERRALDVVAVTFFLLAAYTTFEAVNSLLGHEAPDRSVVGLVLSVLSLVIMPALAWWKQRTGRQMGSRALVADAAETWVCSYLSLALLAGVGLHELFGWWWADPVGALAMLPVILWQGWETLGEAREHDDHEQSQ
jgi:divalent metal cation (Fe/Co/Zn/Cd) transporter